MASELKHTVAPSGGDFTSLDACIDHLVAVHPDFVTADVYGLVEIQGDWSGGADATAVSTSGLTLDATRYLSVYTDENNRASAAGWSDSIYRLSVSNASAFTAMYLSAFYLDGLQIEVTGMSGNYQVPVDVSTAHPGTVQYYSNLRLRGCYDTVRRKAGWLSQDSDTTAYLWNIYSYNFTGNASYDTCFLFYSGTVYAYNCVAYNASHAGFKRQGGTASVYDSASFNNGDDFNGTITVDYCASDDNDGTNNVAESGGGAAWPDDFEDAANGDFRLLSTSNLVDAASEAGSGVFSDDIDGKTRDASWDVGPYEYAAGGGYSITADGGSYTLTGQDVGTLKGSKVAAEAGSIAITGQDAGTFYGRKVEAEAGTYVLSGIDLALLRAAKIVAEAGAVALTGMDASALFHRVMEAEPNHYDVTGQDIGLLRGYGIAAEAGAYTLTGLDAALLRAARLAAESGSYVLVGLDATLVYVPGGGAYVLTAEGGTYAITGMSADVLKSSRLAADPGAYVLTGVDAATLIGRLIDAGAGAYAISGLDAELLRAAKLAAEAGAYVVTGEDASLSASVAVLVALLELLRPSPRIVLSPQVQRIVTLSPSPRIVQTTRSEP